MSSAPGKPESFDFRPIGVIRSRYRQKFGIPRQAGLVPSAEAVLELRREAGVRSALAGLEGFTHLWVIFVFHETGATGWKPTVRPPRLGGSRRVGVLASRSPHRPNPIGLSLVELVAVEPGARPSPRIRVRGGDFLDGTPVLDVKPYLPYADRAEGASSGWAEEPIRKHAVRFEPNALEELRRRAAAGRDAQLESFVRETLALDPRPAFQQRKARTGKFGMRVDDFDVKWRIEPDAFVVTAITDVTSSFRAKKPSADQGRPRRKQPPRE